MKKIIIVLIIILITPLTATAASFSINNKVVTTPKIIKGRSLIPARLLNSFFAEHLEWRGAEKKLIVSNPNYDLKLQASNKVAAVNNQPYPLEVAPRLINNQLFMPVRLLTKLYGGKLSWHNQKKEINYHSYRTAKNDGQTKSNKKNKDTISFKAIHNSPPLIVIDPGHGGSDPGAIGVSGLEEKVVNLEIALQLERRLKEEGYRIMLTRYSDRFIPLLQRAKLANTKKADIFISLHANYNYRSYVQGTATYAHWYASEKNWALAWYVQNEMINHISLLDNGLKAANFLVLRETKMPALLVETAFLSNPKEERLLNSTDFQTKVVTGITAGIKKYLLNL